MSDTILLDPIDQKIIELHEGCRADAESMARKAIMCGALLIKKHATVEDGGWGDYCATVKMSRSTAFRYMTIASKYGGEKIELAEGKTLLDLYREFGLLKQLEGGGQRNGKSSRGGGQLFFDFNLFGGFMRVIAQTEGNPFLTVDLDELQQTRESTQHAMELMDAALKTAVPKEAGAA